MYFGSGCPLYHCRLHPMWSSFVILCFNRNSTFPCPLPLLLSKPCSFPCKTNFFLGFPHSLLETCTIYPLSSHSSPPFLQGIHRLGKSEFYCSRCIFSMPFSQKSILIHNCRDNKRLPQGTLKNSLYASL